MFTNLKIVLAAESRTKRVRACAKVVEAACIDDLPPLTIDLAVEWLDAFIARGSKLDPKAVEQAEELLNRCLA